MIKFRFTPQFRDYWRLNLHYVTGMTRRLHWFAGAMFFLYLFSPWLASLPGRERTAVQSYVLFLPLLALPAILAFMVVATFAAAKKRWRSADELRTGRDYEITEEGIQIRGDGVSGFLEWRHFSSAEFSKGWFFLKTAQNAFHYFPATVVPDVSALVSLVERKINQTKGLRSAQAVRPTDR